MADEYKMAAINEVNVNRLTYTYLLHTRFDVFANLSCYVKCALFSIISYHGGVRGEQCSASPPENFSKKI